MAGLGHWPRDRRRRKRARVLATGATRLVVGNAIIVVDPNAFTQVRADMPEALIPNTHWISSGGGPFVLLPVGSLDSWRGTADVSDGPSDYDRACAVTEYWNPLPNDEHPVVILGDAPMETAWWPTPRGDGGVIVRVEYATNDQEIVNAVVSLPDDRYAREDSMLSVPGDLVVFDSAYGGAELASTTSLRIQLPTGDYQVETAAINERGRMGVIVHRLTRR